jgi:hypothetical protein
MQSSILQLREHVAQAQDGLQETGEALLKLLDMQKEASTVLAAIIESRKAPP